LFKFGFLQKFLYFICGCEQCTLVIQMNIHVVRKILDINFCAQTQLQACASSYSSHPFCILTQYEM